MVKTGLMIAADRNNTVLIQHLIDSGATVNLTDASGATALMWASHRGHLASAKILLATGQVDLLVENQGGYTALMLAEYNQYPEMVALLKQTMGDH